MFVLRLGGSEDEQPWVHDVVKMVVASRNGAEAPKFAELERVGRYVPPGHNGSGQVSILELIRDTRWSFITDVLDADVGEAVIRSCASCCRCCSASMPTVL